MSLYVTTVDHVEKFPYDVMVRPHDVIIPQAIEEGHIAPLLSYDFGQEFVRSRRTIRQLIETTLKRNAWEIVRQVDVIDIYHRLHAYRIETDHLRENKDYKVFMVGFTKFESAIRDMTKVVLRASPHLREFYTNEGNPLVKMIMRYYGITDPNIDPFDPVPSINKAIEDSVTRTKAEPPKVPTLADSLIGFNPFSGYGS